MKLAVAALVVAGLAIGCGGGRGKPPALSAKLEHPETQAEKLLALLPPGAQLVVEVDLARLRANPVVGALVTKLVTGAPLDLPGEPKPAAPALLELLAQRRLRRLERAPRDRAVRAGVQVGAPLEYGELGSELLHAGRILGSARP